MQHSPWLAAAVSLAGFEDEEKGVEAILDGGKRAAEDLGAGVFGGCAGGEDVGLLVGVGLGRWLVGLKTDGRGEFWILRAMMEHAQCATQNMIRD